MIDWNDVDWDRVTSIEMLCRSGHVNVFTVRGQGCEMCGLKLEYQFSEQERHE